MWSIISSQTVTVISTQLELEGWGVQISMLMVQEERKMVMLMQ